MEFKIVRIFYIQGLCEIDEIFNAHLQGSWQTAISSTSLPCLPNIASQQIGLF